MVQKGCYCFLSSGVKCSFGSSVHRYWNLVPSKLSDDGKISVGQERLTFKRDLWCLSGKALLGQTFLIFFWGMIFHGPLTEAGLWPCYLCWSLKNQLFFLQENVSGLPKAGTHQHLSPYFYSVISWLLSPLPPQSLSPLELRGLWRKGPCLSCPLASPGYSTVPGT